MKKCGNNDTKTSGEVRIPFISKVFSNIEFTLTSKVLQNILNKVIHVESGTWKMTYFLPYDSPLRFSLADRVPVTGFSFFFSLSFGFWFHLIQPE